MRDNSLNSRDGDFQYKNHVQYDRHYSNNHTGKKIFLVLFVLLLAYGYFFVPAVRQIFALFGM